MEKEIEESYKKAGRIAFEAVQLGRKLIKPGVNMISILDDIEKFILSKDASPAFPAQISLNAVAAHFCPAQDDVILKEGDIVKLDLGVSYDGYIADTAYTVDLGSNKELVTAAQDALKAALKIIKPGVRLGDVGKEIQEVIGSKGLSPIKNLSGHGLGRYRIHGEPTVPNFDTHDKTELVEDQVIAIEPFATNGAGVVYESSNPTLFSLIAERPVRSMMTRQVLNEVKKYNGLPFCSRWLQRKFGVGQTTFALREMDSYAMIDSHPPLIEKEKGLVSQAEHSVIVKDKPIIYTKGEDD
jgi:methionyl aminopeptidase